MRSYYSTLLLSLSLVSSLSFAALNDIDGDGIPDHLDTDRDGDGLSNFMEQTGGTDPDVPDQFDTDEDGIPDAIDDDIDNDGVPNQRDSFPLDGREYRDTDGDGVGDNADLDRDGDGVRNDLEEKLGYNPNDIRSRPKDSD
ncbi:MAG: thrombospondin type 3 repeat-containing protein, partial [Thalassolituus oleivorans]|uniref:thrombospondin type 3 repeat-containing protein n=1 Tax=Thalassolituus oleivorans TaxID=187493 RepID=UPI001B465B5A